MKANLVVLMLVGAAVTARAEPLLVTGQVSSTNQHVVTAPKTDKWQIQVQWLLEEGAIVQKGDLIAVFDAGNIKAQIKQNQERLVTENLVLQQKQVELAQAVNTAKGKVELAKLEVEKANIEASVNSAEVSEYDKGQYRLTLERAIFAKVKAEQELEAKQSQFRTEMDKQKLAIVKIEEELAFQHITLERVSVKARVAGSVSHKYHPWNGDKITAGSMVQQAMTVMSVQSQDGYQVLAWIHEVDAHKLSVGDNATLTLDAYPNSSYQGQVVSVASQSEQKEAWGTSAYHQVKFRFIQQPTLTLKPGMSVRAVIDKEV